MQKRMLLAALALSFSTAVSAQSINTISQQETTRLMRTLSADDMEGRASFTPGIEKAADFISAEFARIGLKPLAGATGFRQTFHVYRITPTEHEAKLNGKKIAKENIFAITEKKELEWKTDSKRPVIVIGENDDFRKSLGKLNADKTDALVLVHPTHTEAFKGYQNYINRGSVKQELGKNSSNRVFILTDNPTAGKYKLEVENKIEKLPLTNVAGMIEGKRKDEFVVFSGHYDHIGIGHAIDGDSIANGADDDASGTTAMMLLAEYYKQQGQPERTLLFVAFTSEEIGGYGSRYFSEQLNPDRLVAMFNIEMVGKTAKFGPNSAYLTGFERSTLGTLMQKRLAGTPYAIHPDPYPEQNLFYRSDNATLARLGVPAHTISSVQIDQDKTYHTVKDEFENLDMDHMTHMIRLIALASAGVVNGEDTPTRVDKTLVK